MILHRDNAHAFTQANGVRILVELIPLAHLHTSRAVVNNMSTAIEASPDATKDSQEKEWYYGNADKERNGPISFAEMCELYENKDVTAKTKVWAQGKYSQSWIERKMRCIAILGFLGLEGWRLLHQVAQLKWTLTAKSQPVMNESEMTSLILSVLISVCR